MNNDFYVGQKVLVKRMGWEGKGTVDSPKKKCDVEGVISSVKGVTPEHQHNKKYKVAFNGQEMYTDGVPFIPSDSNEIGKLIALS